MTEVVSAVSWLELNIGHRGRPKGDGFIANTSPPCFASLCGSPVRRACRRLRSGSHVTHCWREPDSNHRSRSWAKGSFGCCRREMPDRKLDGVVKYRSLARRQRSPRPSLSQRDRLFESVFLQGGVLCEPGSAGAGRLLARERANEDGRATTRPHRYGGIFLGWLANAASHPGSCRRCAACSYPPWPSMGRTRFRGRDRRANGRRTCTAERQCNSPSRGFLSIRPGHSLDDDGASGFDPLPTIVSLNGDDGPCP
jgi:hypothetical protein